MRTSQHEGEAPGREESLRGRSLSPPVTQKCDTGPGKGKRMGENLRRRAPVTVRRPLTLCRNSWNKIKISNILSSSSCPLGRYVGDGSPIGEHVFPFHQ